MRIAPHTFILASLLTLASCSPAADAPTPKSTDATTTVDTAASAGSAAKPAENNENARLDEWFEAQFKASTRAYPQRLTSLGINERQDEWDNPTRSYRLEQLDKSREALEEMRERFDVEKLDESHKLSYRLFEKNVTDRIAGRKWWDHGYTYSQMRGAHSADAENYLARLETIHEPLDEFTRQAKAKFEKGIAPPHFVYDFVIESSQNIMAGTPADAESDDLNLLLADFEKKVEKLSLDEDTKEALYERAINAITDSLAPAYERIIAEMTRQKEAATTDDGAWKLPDGEDYYAYRLNLMTTTDMSANAIHELGLSEVDRIHTEMREIMKTVEFDGSSLNSQEQTNNFTNLKVKKAARHTYTKQLSLLTI